MEEQQEVVVQEPFKPQQILCKVPDPSPGKQLTSLDNRSGWQMGACISCSGESNDGRFPQYSCVAQATCSDAHLG